MNEAELFEDQEAELEEKASECLTVEQEMESLEREIGSHYQEILAARKRYLAPEDMRHLSRAVLMFEQGIIYNKRRIAELEGQRDHASV